MKLAIKIDVDTYAGTRDGVPRLVRILSKYCVPATFLFSLGPDNTGKSLSRVFQKGFIKKCLRSNVASNYGLKTLMYGTFLPAPLIAKKCVKIMREAYNSGFECGVHSWDHYKWQNRIFKMRDTEVEAEFMKAYAEFEKIMGFSPNCCGAPGWQISPAALEVEENNRILYASDVRGKYPFFPKMCGRRFTTLQIPSTLPTLDEILGEKELDSVASSHFEEMGNTEYSVITIHAELEGLKYIGWFEDFLKGAIARGVEFYSLETRARQLLREPQKIPVCEILMRPFPGRSGKLAVQKI